MSLSLGPRTAQCTRAGFLSGLRGALPIGLGVATYGFVFGVLAHQAGMPPVQALSMSSIVFAGASQFVALELWQAPLPVLTLVITTLVVNLRHLLMGMVVREKLQGLSPIKAYVSLFFLVDENFAYSMTQWKDGKADMGILAGSGICLFLAWNLATLAGAALGTGGLDPVAWGMDFAFTAIFIFLATGLWRDQRDLIPWITAGATAILFSHLLPGKWYILLGSLAGSITGALIHDHD
ncbi:MAG: AzlC family ABC transporter permease [Desulfobacterales bacterium]|nr:AzlC family ABC transporter permease [Desulfobacterales bacterium]